MFKKTRITFLLPAFFLLSLSYMSCKKKEDIQYPRPALSLSGSELVNARVGTVVDIPLKIDAGGGAKSIIVKKGGGYLAEIPVNADATEYLYKTEPLSETLSEGDEIIYGFILANRNGIDSDEIKVVVKAEVYDKINIGTTELYNVTIPDEGIASSGTETRLIVDRNYYISESITFEPGSKFLIEEGVHVYLNADASSPVEIEIQGEAEITGSASAPVVFTSSRVLTSENPASPGDWSTFRLTGTGDASNNGKVSYLRIEYAADRAFRLSDVGAATVLDHIQVYRSLGEGFMITSGNARLKYLVATNCEGGSFRLGNTYNGFMQNVISVNTEYFIDNDDLTIREDASPVISNVTLLGPGSDVENTHGLRIRANASPKIYNAIVAQFPRRGVRAGDNVEITDMSGPTVFAHSFVFDVPTDPFRELATAFAGTFDAEGEMTENTFNNNVTELSGKTYILNTIDGIGVNAFVPQTAESSDFDPATLNAFFSAAKYAGAVKDGTDDWTRGWVKNPDGSVR